MPPVDDSLCRLRHLLPRLFARKPGLRGLTGERVQAAAQQFRKAPVALHDAFVADEGDGFRGGIEDALLLLRQSIAFEAFGQRCDQIAVKQVMQHHQRDEQTHGAPAAEGGSRGAGEAEGQSQGDARRQDEAVEGDAARRQRPGRAQTDGAEHQHDEQVLSAVLGRHGDEVKRAPSEALQCADQPQPSFPSPCVVRRRGARPVAVHHPRRGRGEQEHHCGPGCQQKGVRRWPQTGQYKAGENQARRADAPRDGKQEPHALGARARGHGGDAARFRSGHDALGAALRSRLRPAPRARPQVLRRWRCPPARRQFRRGSCPCPGSSPGR